MELLKCILVDDEPFSLERMEKLVNLTGKAKVIKKLNHSEHAVEVIGRSKPDLVFLDVEMPGLSGFELVKKLHEHHFFPTIVFVTGYDQYAIKAIKAEAFDYLVKPVDMDELNECLSRYLRRNQSDYFHGYELLSTREQEVQRLVMQGKTSEEISKLLYISKNTVDTHRRNIRKKLKGGF